MGILALVCSVAVAVLPGEDAYRAGRQAEEQGLYPKAFGAYRECAETGGPLEEYSRIRMAVCKAGGGDAEAAVVDLEALLSETREGAWRAFAHVELARVAAGAEERDVAAEHFDRALDTTLNPWWIEDVRWEAGLNLVTTNDRHKDGLDYFRKAASATPWPKKRFEAASILAESDDPEDRVEAAFAFLRAGGSDEAAKILSDFEGDPPDDEDLQERVLHARGRYLLAKGKRDEGRALLVGLSEQTGDAKRARSVLVDVVSSYVRRDAFEEAEGLLERLTELGPNSRERYSAIDSLAGRYQRKKEFGKALEKRELALEGHPLASGRERAVLEIASIYKSMERDVEAVAAYDAFAESYPGSDKRAEALFWAGALLEEAGEADGAMERYRAAAARGVTRYYGYRAQQRLAELGDPEARKFRPVAVDESVVLVRALPVPWAETAVGAVTDDPRLSRLRFFASQGYPETEWEALGLGEALSDDAEPGALYAAMAQAGGSYSTMQFANARRYGQAEDGTQNVTRLRIRYPRAYWELAQSLGEETGLDPYLILCIARQESTYRPALESPAGAKGLMQVMPSTAEWVVEEFPEIGTHHARMLMKPASSMRLGAHYLAYLLERYEGNFVYAIASYNAGPRNCDSWRRNFEGDTLDEFIEAIPFTETRNYVKRVLAHYTTYLSIYPDA